MIRFVFPVLLTLMACTEKDAVRTGDDADTGGFSTTGDGCIRINGAGGWSTIGAALDAAENGDVIYLCAGTYEERVVIEKSVTIKGPNTGDPAIIGVACSIVSDITGGKYNLLKWDKQERKYYPIEINLYEKGEIDE